MQVALWPCQKNIRFSYLTQASSRRWQALSWPTIRCLASASLLSLPSPWRPLVYPTCSSSVSGPLRLRLGLGPSFPRHHVGKGKMDRGASTHNNSLYNATTHPPASRLAAQDHVVESHNLVVAFVQCVAVYYSVAILLHFVVPRCIRTKRVQASRQKTRDTYRDALRSLPSLAVKALTLFAVEVLHSQGYGRLTDESLLEVILFAQP